MKKGSIVTQTGLKMPSSQTQVFSYIFLNQNGTILADEGSETPEFDTAAGIETFKYLVVVLIIRSFNVFGSVNVMKQLQLFTRFISGHFQISASVMPAP